MKVSVIIPVHNNHDRLLQCLELLQNQTLQPDEIVVVDNNSTENIYSVCEQFSNVRYCQESKQGSYAARNRGIAIASGEILAFTDSDCLPSDEWLERGVNALKDANLVAGHIEFCCRSSRPTPVEYADMLSHLRQRDYAREGYAATGNAITYRECFDKVGFFRDDLLSLGDREWGLRLSSAGGRVVYCSDAIVFHPARSSLRDLLRKVQLQASHKHKLKPFRWGHFFNQLLPLGVQFWRSVLNDPNLKHWEKLHLAAVIHSFRWTVAIVMLKSLLTSPKHQ